MKFRKISLAIVTVASLSPLTSFASPEKASVTACAHAFASTITSKGANGPGFKLDYRARFNSSITDFYPTEYTFVMEARDPKTGSAIARARCSADSSGVVTGITQLPLDAQLAAR